MSIPSSRPRTPRRSLGRVLPLLIAVGLFVAIVAILLIRRPWEVVTRPASIPTDDRDIVFMSNRDGDWDLYLLTLATGDVVNLTGAADDGDGYDDDGFPAFSADGGALTFLSNRTRSDDGRLDAFLMNVDGSDVRPLQNDLPTIMSIVGSGRFNWDYSFAISGALAFVTLRDLNLEVYTQAAIGDEASSDPRNLTTNGAIDWFPAWSFDAAQLAFASNRDGASVEDQEIYVVPAGGGAPTRLTFHPQDDIFPAWTSDGRIVFYSERDSTLRDADFPLYVLDPAQPDADPQRVSGVLSAANGTPVTVDPQISPNGDAQIYLSNASGNWDLYYANVLGQDPINLTQSAGDADDVFAVWRTN